MKEIENIQRLKSDISKVIDNTQMPKEIKDKVSEILREYEYVVKEYTNNVVKLKNQYNLEQIMSIIHYAEKDFEESLESVEVVNENAYACKKDEMSNRIIRKIDKMIDGEEKRNNILSIDLFDSNEEERKHNEGIVELKDLSGDRESIEFLLNTIKENIIAELKSSRSAIIDKTEEIQIIEEDEVKREFDEHSRKRTIQLFEEEVENIIQKVNKEIPELGKVLEVQDGQIYEEIKGMLKENGIEIPEEKTYETKRRDFMQELSEGVEVSEEKALEKMEEQRKEDSKKMNLDENIIS